MTASPFRKARRAAAQAAHAETLRALAAAEARVAGLERERLRLIEEIDGANAEAATARRQMVDRHRREDDFMERLSSRSLDLARTVAQLRGIDAARLAAKRKATPEQIERMANGVDDDLCGDWFHGFQSEHAIARGYEEWARGLMLAEAMAPRTYTISADAAELLKRAEKAEAWLAMRDAELVYLRKGDTDEAVKAYGDARARLTAMGEKQ